MLIRLGTTHDVPALLSLVRTADLPLAGLEDPALQLRLAEEAGGLLGMAGLEVHGSVGLLRSVVVTASAQGRGVAARLVGDVLDQAHDQGLQAVYLLTVSAERYFPRFGFETVPRTDTPPALLASREFQDACPQIATLMRLTLYPTQEHPMTQTTPGLEGQTTTLALHTALSGQAQRPLEFWLNGELLVSPGYHVTEVKAITIEAMDCGGKAASWRETVIQLMDGNAEEAQAGFMTNRKFLAIYDRVTKKIPVRDEAEVRFEYGNARSPALQYHVHQIEARPERVIVHLQTPGVQCKAGDACRVPSEAGGQTDGCAPESGCCTPAPTRLITLG